MKLKFISLFFVIGLLFISGCSGAKQIHERLLVQGIGVDKKDAVYTVTTQIFNTQGGPDMGEEKNSASVITADGRSVLDALTNITRITGKEPLYSQNLLVVIGEEAAKEGVSDIMDFFIRHYEARPSVDVFISKSEAKQTMNSKNGEQLIMAKEIAQLAKSEDLSSAVMPSNVLKFVSDLQSRKADPRAVSLLKREGDNGEEIIADGTAVFDGGKLSGYLDADQTRGALLIDGRVKNATEVLALEGVGNVTYTIVDSSSKIDVALSNGSPSFFISVSADANVYEIEQNKTEKLPNSYFEVMQEALQTKLKQLAEESIQKSVLEYKSDIFNFGRILFNKEPEYFKSIEDNWKEILQTSKYQVDVKVKIKRIGQEASPV